MLNNPPNDPQMQQGQGNVLGQQIVPGANVYGADGDKIGTVSEYSTDSNYLVVQKGWLFPHDIYVPMSAVDRTDQDGIYLALTKDEVKNQNWENPPISNWAAGDIGANAARQPASTTTTTTPGMRSNVRNDQDVNDLDVANRGTTAAPVTGQNVNVPGHPTPPREGDIAVPEREEELVARKQREEAGRVHLHRDVVEEQQTLNVPVTHEEVHVERFPVQGNSADIGPDTFTEKDIDVPVMGEQVNTEKRARVNEEVHLHKDQVTAQQPVSDTVRKERVRIEGVDSQGNLETTNPNVAPIDESTDQPPPQR